MTIKISKISGNIPDKKIPAKVPKIVETKIYFMRCHLKNSL